MNQSTLHGRTSNEAMPSLLNGVADTTEAPEHFSVLAAATGRPASNATAASTKISDNLRHSKGKYFYLFLLLLGFVLVAIFWQLSAQIGKPNGPPAATSSIGLAKPPPPSQQVNTVRENMEVAGGEKPDANTQQRAGDVARIEQIAASPAATKEVSEKSKEVTVQEEKDRNALQEARKSAEQAELSARKTEVQASARQASNNNESKAQAKMVVDKKEKPVTTSAHASENNTQSVATTSTASSSTRAEPAREAVPVKSSRTDADVQLLEAMLQHLRKAEPVKK